MGGAFTIALGPIGLIILGIAGVIAITALLIWKWDEVKAKTQEVWNAIPGWIKWALAIIGGPLIGLIFTTGLIIEHWDKLGRVTRVIWNGIATVFSATWNAIRTVLLAAWNGIRHPGLFGHMERDQDGPPGCRWNAIRDVWNAVWPPIQTAALAVWNGVTDMWDRVWNGLLAVLKGYWGLIRAVVGLRLHAVEAR